MDLANHFNRQVSKIITSLTRQFDEQASGTGSVLKLTLGEPDSNTPRHAKKAAKEATDADFFHYTRMPGLLDIREVAAYLMKEKYHSTYQPVTEISVTAEATEATSTSLLTILEQDDKVLLLALIYPGYELIITLTGAESIYLDMRDNDFVLTPEMIEAAMAEHGEQVKIIILNYPSNLTGVTYSRQELQAVANVLRKYDIFVVGDRIHNELTCDESHVSIAETLCDQTILTNGLPKSHAITGWRIDFIFAPTILTAGIVKVHQYLVTAAAIMSQKAAVRALIEGVYDAEIMKEEYRKRRDFVYKQMTQLGFEVARPNRAFYIFAEIPTGYEQDSMEFCIDLAQREVVALIPGISFDPEAEGYVRISCASDMDKLTTAMERIAYYMVTRRIAHWPLQILYTPLLFTYI